MTTTVDTNDINTAVQAQSTCGPRPTTENQMKQHDEQEGSNCTYHFMTQLDRKNGKLTRRAATRGSQIYNIYNKPYYLQYFPNIHKNGAINDLF